MPDFLSCSNPAGAESVSTSSEPLSNSSSSSLRSNSNPSSIPISTSSINPTASDVISVSSRSNSSFVKVFSERSRSTITNFSFLISTNWSSMELMSTVKSSPELSGSAPKFSSKVINILSCSLSVDASKGLRSNPLIPSSERMSSSISSLAFASKIIGRFFEVCSLRISLQIL